MSQPTVTEVMRVHASDAVEYARTRFRMELDGSSQSLEKVDRMVDAMYFDVPRTFFAKLFRRGPSHDEVWSFAKMWGGYVGEVIRKRWGGVWRTTMQPSGHAQISFDVLGQRYFPVEVMHRRLHDERTRGKQKLPGAQDLYERVVQELGMARIDAGAAPVAPPLPRKMDPIPPSAPLLVRRQTVSDILGLEPTDLTGERSFLEMNEISDDRSTIREALFTPEQDPTRSQGMPSDKPPRQ